MTPNPKTGPEIMTDMTEAPTLDRFFDRDPKTLTDEQFWSLIGVLRDERALFIEKEDK